MSYENDPDVNAFSITKPQYSVDDVKKMVFGQESNFGNANTSKANYAGAYGPMQITEATFNGLKKQGLIPSNYDINNPEHSKKAGEILIEEGYKRHKGDADKVLAEYYAGPKAIKNDTIDTSLRDLKNPKAPNVGQYIQQAKNKLNAYETDPDIQAFTYNPQNQVEKPKDFFQELVEPLQGISYEGFKKESMLPKIANVIATSMTGTDQEKIALAKQAEQKAIQLAGGIKEFSKHPIESIKQVTNQIVEHPGQFLGQTIKGIIYDPETLLPIGGGSKALSVESQLAKQFETKGARSVGAAEADLPVRIKEAISRSSPEKQAVFNQLPIEKLTEQDLKAIENHNKFEKFGMTPTEGQALEDTSKMSDEFNARKQDPRLQERFEERDPKLIQGFNTINEKVSPDVFETDPQRLASMPLDKIKKVYDQKEQTVKDLWKSANSASGTAQAPIDVGALRENIINGLREKQRTRYVPPELQADLDEALSQGFLTPEQYENFRTDTALIARTNSNPMARQAAAIIRGKLEAVPIKDEFAQYKPLYDQARKATADLHDFEESNVVKAAISDTRTKEELAANMPHPAAKNFIAKHYSGNTPQVEVQRLIDLIGKDSPEHQALNKLKLEEFKLNSGIVNDKGTVSQARLNKQIYEQHKTNLATMLGQEAAKDLQDLADVAHLTEPKKGVHSVNTSNTEILAEQNRAKKEAKQTATNIGSGIAEAKINAIVPGAGTVGRSFLKGRAEQKALQKERIEKLQESQRRLSPTAGIGTKLKDIGK
jgi:hypothetical protein